MLPTICENREKCTFSKQLVAKFFTLRLLWHPFMKIFDLHKFLAIRQCRSYGRQNFWSQYNIFAEQNVYLDPWVGQKVSISFPKHQLGIFFFGWVTKNFSWKIVPKTRKFCNAKRLLRFFWHCETVSSFVQKVPLFAKPNVKWFYLGIIEHDVRVNVLLVWVGSVVRRLNHWTKIILSLCDAMSAYGWTLLINSEFSDKEFRAFRIVFSDSLISSLNFRVSFFFILKDN